MVQAAVEGKSRRVYKAQAWSVSRVGGKVVSGSTKGEAAG